MSQLLKAGKVRICPLCEARNKVGVTNCLKCRAPLGAAPVVVGVPTPARARKPSARSSATRMIAVGGLVAAIGAGLVVREAFDSSREPSALSEDVQAAGTEMAPANALPPQVTGWTPGASAPGAPAGDALVPQAAPAWSTTSFPVAPIQQPPADPATSMVGITPESTGARAAMRRGHVFTNDDLAETRGSEAPVSDLSAPARPAENPPPVSAPRSDDVARRGASAGEPDSRVAAAQRRVLAIRDSMRAGDDSLKDEMEDAIDEVRKAQKEANRDRDE